MALELRILPPTEDALKLGANSIMALLGEYIRGTLDAAEVKTQFALSLGEPLTDGDKTDVDHIITTIDDSSEEEHKHEYVHLIRDVCYLSEDDGLSLYNTGEKIKTKLGFI